MTLSSFFMENNRVALAFSGGVDSSYLLYSAKICEADVRAYYIKTAFQPKFEYDDAMRLARELDLDLTVIDADILAAPCVAENSADRCYYCKTALFSQLCRRAAEDGYDIVIDGTNASDNADDRPGMRALREMGIRSPLRECGLTKDDIRRLSEKAGLFTYEKPAYACLATRIPTGQRLTAENLAEVEGAENAMLFLGFSDFRVRVYNGAARIQVTADQAAKVIEKADKIREMLKPYFTTVMLDLEWRE